MNSHVINEKLHIAAEQNKSEQHFWKQSLSGNPVKSYFPYPIRHNRIDTYVEGSYGVEIPDPLFTRLLAASGNSNHKLHVILLSALIFLLDRYTGNRDIIVCTPIYKVEAGLELMNTLLPIRHHIDDSDTVRDLLKKVGRTVVETTRHQNYPIRLLLEQLVPSEQCVYTGLLDVGIVLENIHDQAYIQDLPLNIVFNFCRTGSNLRVRVEYNACVYNERDIESIGNHLKYVLAELTSDMERQLSQVSMMPKMGNEILLLDLNANPFDPAAGKSLHESFESQVSRTPKQTSIVFNENYFTFETLNNTSNELAVSLRNRSVTAGDVVGLETGQTIETIIGFLAILKVGGACLPLSPGLPDSPKEKLLDDARASLLLSINKPCPGVGDENNLHPGYRFLDWKQGAQGPSPENPGNALAYIVRETGTPGNTRLIRMEHRRVISSLTGIKSILYKDENEKSNVALVSSMSTDGGLRHVFGALLSGCRLYIVPDEARKNGAVLPAFFCRYHIGISDASPFHIQRMIGYVDEWGGDLSIPVTHFFIPVGYLSSPSLLRFLDRFKKNTGGITIVYGIPGGCTAITVLEVTRETMGSLPPIPMGKEVPGFGLYIADRIGQPLPLGAAGELAVPDAPPARETMRHTGYIARSLADGAFEFLGKARCQTIIKNVKIVLDTIAYQLLTHESVLEAVVLELPEAVATGLSSRRGKSKPNGNADNLCAYFTAPRPIPVSGLKTYLAKRLPEFLLPAFYLQVEEIPLTDDDAVDVDMLLSYAISPVEESANRLDPIEEKLVAIWADILERDVQTINKDDLLFELGGQSLSVIMMSSRIHKEFNISIPIPEIFELSTIEHIAEYIKKAAKAEYSALLPSEEKQYYELSSAQKRIYLLQQLDPESIGYNVPEIVELHGRLSDKKLEKCFKKLIERHEVLRTSFEIVNDRAVQKINRRVEFSMEYRNLETEDYTDAEQKTISRFIRPFDLSKAPLLRLGVIKKDESRYILVIDRHHIISDAASRRIVLIELMHLYDDNELPPLRFQYKDYSEWQHSNKQKELLEAQKNYWLRQLTGEIPVLNLPTDYPRPAVRDFAGKTAVFSLRKEETRELKKLAMAEGTTVSIVLLAFFGVFLSKMSSQEDVTIGIPVVGRRHPDLENIIGIFINTLVIGISPLSQDKFTGYLDHVKRRAFDAYENQMYPFEELVENLPVRRDMSRNPLFDVMFSFVENKSRGGLDEMKSRDWLIKPYFHEIGVSKFDLSLSAYEQEERLNFTMEYSTRLFRGETILRFIHYFKNIIFSAIAAPGRRIADIAAITGEEKTRLLIEFNHTDSHYPQNKTLHRLFEEQVERTPDLIAVNGHTGRGKKQPNPRPAPEAGSVVTYRELNTASNRLAYYLKERGIEADAIAGIMMGPSLEMITYILAILKAGGAYLPIDPEYPKDRIDFVLKDSRAKVLLTTDTLLLDREMLTERPGWKNLEIILADSLVSISPSASDFTAPPTSGRAPSPFSLAYIIYTSGTTGKPKGVMIRHRSAVNYTWWSIKRYVGEKKVSFPLFTSLSFDLTVTSIFTPVLSGNTIFIYAGNGKELAIEQILKENVVDTIKLTPSHLKLVVELMDDSFSSNIKQFIVGGEVLETEFARKAVDKFNGQIALYNEYGPTEATVGCMIYQFSPGTGTRPTVPIGTPADNVRVFILDKNKKPVPVGVVGELYILGDGIARGYLNRPELTAEKFDHDFGDYRDCDNERIFLLKRRGNSRSASLFKTGDLACWLPCGNIEFVGRIDLQVKIRGYRIELGEIENRLLKHEEINDAVVTVMKWGEMNENTFLCAYIVGAREFEVSELVDYLSRELPGYMIPSYFVQLDAIPLTPNGKVDRRALPAPQANTSENGFAPTDEIEEKIVEIWSDVLGVEKTKIGMDSNFFQLGGHSLKATMMTARIHKTVNVRPPLVGFFQDPTIRGLIKYIKGKEMRLDRCAWIKPVEKKEYYPLSSSQNRLYFLQQLSLDSTGYNMPQIVMLEGGLDVERLESTFNKIIARHEGLRISFKVIDGRAVQQIADTVQLSLEYYDLENPGTNPGKDRKADDIIRSFIRPFDLNRGPLTRIGVIKLKREKHILMADVHHIITDGISRNILIRDFMDLYAGKDLIPLKLQYKDFSEWENSRTQKEMLNKQEEYWLSQLSGQLPGSSMPYDFPVSANRNPRAGHFLFEIDAKETLGLREIALREEATMNILLLTIYTVLLSKINGREDIIIGMGIAGRRHAYLEHIVGMFVNILPIRNYPRGEKTFTEFFREVKGRIVAAYDNQDYPFNELVVKLKLHVNRGINRQPLLNAVFGLQNMDMTEIEIPGLKLVPHEFDNDTAKFDFLMVGVERKKTLLLRIEYDSGLFKKETIVQFSIFFRRLVTGIIENPNKKLNELRVLSGEEMNRILVNKKKNEETIRIDFDL